jgi:hypothetical protein
MRFNKIFLEMASIAKEGSAQRQRHTLFRSLGLENLAMISHHKTWYDSLEKQIARDHELGQKNSFVGWTRPREATM